MFDCPYKFKINILITITQCANLIYIIIFMWYFEIPRLGMFDCPHKFNINIYLLMYHYINSAVYIMIRRIYISLSGGSNLRGILK